MCPAGRRRTPRWTNSTAACWRRSTPGDIGGAEDLLFAESDPDDRRYLELAVDFYARLNDLTDAQLEAAGFGRDELEEGLRDMAGRFGVSLL